MSNLPRAALRQRTTSVAYRPEMDPNQHSMNLDAPQPPGAVDAQFTPLNTRVRVSDAVSSLQQENPAPISVALASRQIAICERQRDLQIAALLESNFCEAVAVQDKARAALMHTVLVSCAERVAQGADRLPDGLIPCPRCGVDAVYPDLGYAWDLQREWRCYTCHRCGLHAVRHLPSLERD